MTARSLAGVSAPRATIAAGAALVSQGREGGVLQRQSEILGPRCGRVIDALHDDLAVAGEIGLQGGRDIPDLRHQRPRQTGLRFSAKARAPSK